jgi:hypothetical protein
MLYYLQLQYLGYVSLLLLSLLLRVLLVRREEEHIFFFCGATTQLGPDRLNVAAVYRSHPRQHSAEQVIRWSHRPLNTQQAQKTKILAHSVIRTRDLNNQADADFRFRPHGKPESGRNVSLEIICLSVLRSLDITSHFCSASVSVKFDLRTLLHTKRSL